ncbi:MAG: hypothetical protein Q8K39_08265 [Undibacterium sp.]|nr:hypothetical protein [Undibacterium sp.]MDP1977637.1 hypothetical protein [Undibacterium sp.]
MHSVLIRQAQPGILCVPHISGAVHCHAGGLRPSVQPLLTHPASRTVASVKPDVSVVSQCRAQGGHVFACARDGLCIDPLLTQQHAPPLPMTQDMQTLQVVAVTDRLGDLAQGIEVLVDKKNLCVWRQLGQQDVQVGQAGIDYNNMTGAATVRLTGSSAISAQGGYSTLLAPLHGACAGCAGLEVLVVQWHDSASLIPTRYPMR